MASAVASLSSPPAMGVQWSNGVFRCVFFVEGLCMLLDVSVCWALNINVDKIKKFLVADRNITPSDIGNIVFVKGKATEDLPLFLSTLVLLLHRFTR